MDSIWTRSGVLGGRMDRGDSTRDWAQGRGPMEMVCRGQMREALGCLSAPRACPSISGLDTPDQLPRRD